MVTVRVSGLGRVADIECRDAEAAVRVRRLMGPLADAGDVLTGPADARLRGTAVDPAEDDPAACRALNGWLLTTTELLALHAGVVARGDRAIAMAAPSGTGKSTLVAACVAAGMDLVSDEALCLEHGRVVPYPRPVALDACARALLHLPRARGRAVETLLTAADLGGRVTPHRHLRLVAIAVLRRPADGTSTRLRSAGRDEVMAELLRRGFTAWRTPEAALVELAGVIRTCSAWQLEAGDPRAAAELVGTLLAER